MPPDRVVSIGTLHPPQGGCFFCALLSPPYGGYVAAKGAGYVHSQPVSVILGGRPYRNSMVVVLSRGKWAPDCGVLYKPIFL